jgi:hypothetical protein
MENPYFCICSLQACFCNLEQPDFDYFEASPPGRLCSSPPVCVPSREPASERVDEMPRPYQAARRGSSSSSSETGDHKAPPSMHESLRSETGAFSEDEEEREDSEQHDSRPVRASILNKNANARQDGSEDEEEGERLLNQEEQQRSRSAEQERAARYGAAAQLDLKLDKSNLRKRRRSFSVQRDPNQRVGLFQLCPGLVARNGS